MRIARWTFTDEVARNVVGGGYFRVVTLYDGNRVHWRRTFDGTMWAGRADRRARKQLREWREDYSAVPR